MRYNYLDESIETRKYEDVFKDSTDERSQKESSGVEVLPGARFLLVLASFFVFWGSRISESMQTTRIEVLLRTTAGI